MWWDKVAIPRVKELLGKRDEMMVAAYKQQLGQKRDLQFELVPGQYVLLRQHLLGKLRMRYSGPYVFLRSTEPNYMTL